MRRRLPSLVRAAVAPVPAPSASSSSSSRDHVRLASLAAALRKPEAAAPAHAAPSASAARFPLPGRVADAEPQSDRSDNFPPSAAPASGMRTTRQQLANGLETPRAQATQPASRRVEETAEAQPVASSSRGSGLQETAGTEGTEARAPRSPRKGQPRSRRRAAADPASRRNTPRLDPIDSLLARPLPTSSYELYAFLRHARDNHRTVPLQWLAWFHAHPRMAPFVSPQSFRFLLHLASFRTDQRLVRSLLSEMHERDVPIDDEARRVLLRGYVRAGMHDAVGEVARAVREAEGRAPVLLPTAKRDLSDKGKGKADLQPGWKGWAARERVQRVEEQVLRAASKVEEELIGHTMRSTQKRRRMRSAVTTEAGPSTFALPRHSTLIPPRPASLAGSDVATLVERLVQERRTDEAISLAEMWLEAHRPSYLDSPPSTALRPAETPLIRYNRLVRQYYSTALVLLNILLKLLYQERPTPSSIRLFVDGFITRHSAPAPAAPLTPNLVTLRQLVVGLLGQAAAWDRAVALVDWFGYRWGIPTTSHASSPRAHFVPPSKIEADRVGLVVGESRAAADAATADAQAAHLSLVAPHNAVPPDVAILLLRHATDQYERGTLGHKARVAAVRAWWARFDKQSSDAWTIARHERVIARAKSVGLLEGSTIVSKRRWVRAAAKQGGRRRKDEKSKEA